MTYRIKTKKEKRYLVSFGVKSVELNAKNKREARKKATSEQNKLIKIKEIE